jgi:hypothetical protein
MNVTVNKFKTAKNLVGGVGTLSMGIYAVQGYVFQYVIIPVFAIVGVDVPFILVIVEALLILGICCGITLFLKKIKPLSICLLGVERYSGVRPCVQLRVYSPVGGSPIK